MQGNCNLVIQIEDKKKVQGIKYCQFFLKLKCEYRIYNYTTNSGHYREESF